jgi:hypothetical protein
MRCDPKFIADLQWMGFQMMSVAHNHAIDFGEGGKLKEIRIYPVDLGYGKPRWQQGRPMLATGAVSKEILDRYQRLSKPFGTRVNIKGKMGIVRL